jgi:hypothetical protein
LQGWNRDEPAVIVVLELTVVVKFVLTVTVDCVAVVVEKFVEVTTEVAMLVSVLVLVVSRAGATIRLAERTTAATIMAAIRYA